MLKYDNHNKQHNRYDLHMELYDNSDAQIIHMSGEIELVHLWNCDSRGLWLTFRLMLSLYISVIYKCAKIAYFDCFGFFSFISIATSLIQKVAVLYLEILSSRILSILDGCTVFTKLISSLHHFIWQYLSAIRPFKYVVGWFVHGVSLVLQLLHHILPWRKNKE